MLHPIPSLLALFPDGIWICGGRHCDSIWKWSCCSLGCEFTCLALRNNRLVPILRHKLVAEAKICKSWTSVKGHQGHQSNIQKKVSIWSYSSDGCNPCISWWVHLAGRYPWCFKSSHLDPQAQGRVILNWKWHGFLKPQSPLTSPISYQTVTPTRDEVFQHMSLWGPSLFKAPQWGSLSSERL